MIMSPSDSPFTSKLPTKYPTSDPSDQPSSSMIPSGRPSGNPSGNPNASKLPTKRPTSSPSEQPSLSFPPSANATSYLYLQRGTDIDGEAVDDSSGYSVSLSDDGSILAIGEIYRDGNGDDSGCVCVYSENKDEDKYTQRGSNIDGKAAFVYFGKSVSLSGDGNILAVG